LAFDLEEERVVDETFDGVVVVAEIEKLVDKGYIEELGVEKVVDIWLVGTFGGFLIAFEQVDFNVSEFSWIKVSL